MTTSLNAMPDDGGAVQQLSEPAVPETSSHGGVEIPFPKHRDPQHQESQSEQVDLDLAEPQSVGPSPDKSGTPLTLDNMQGRLERQLELADRDVLPIVLGAVAAHRLDGDSPWLMVVGPSSGAKTEILNLLQPLADVFFLSDLTDKTFASGLKPESGRDPSLLSRLNHEILVFKDFTTVLSMHGDKRQAVLSQLREIYDGRYDAAWGSDKELHWKGRLGFVAGVTSVIDRHHRVMALLGQRFLLFRFRQPDRHAAGRQALTNLEVNNNRQMVRLAQDIKTFMQGLPTTPPSAAEDIQSQIVEIADLVACARSAVERDGYTRDVDYVPEPEMPGRLARQLLSLAFGVALVCGHEKVEPEDLARVVRVGFDTIPAGRRAVLEALVDFDAPAMLNAISPRLPQYSKTTVRRELENLQLLGLVRREERGSGIEDLWRLLERWQHVLSEARNGRVT